MVQRKIFSGSKGILPLTLILIVVVICKFTLFIKVYTLDPVRIFAPDSDSYIKTANAFLQTGHFVVSPDRPDVPQVERTPGYPLFIASVFFFCGETYPALIIAQILVSLGTIFVTYLLAAKLWNQPIAILAAVLLAVDLPSFINSQQVLTDTLFTFVLNLAVPIGLSFVNTPEHGVFRALSHGSLLAFATLIRPVSYYAIVPLLSVFLFIWKTRFGFSWKKIAIMTILLLCPWGIFVGGWQLRNYLATGNAEFSHVTGWNLLFCRGAEILAQRDGITFEEARQRLGFDDYAAFHPETKGWSIIQLDQRWKQEGLRLIRQYPWLFLQSLLRGFLKMMFGTGNGTLFTYLGDAYKGPSDHAINTYIQQWVLGTTGFSALFCLGETYLILCYLGILASLWQLRQSRTGEWPDHLVIWIVILYFIVVSVAVGPEAYSRFRIPIMPFLSIYAGQGLYQIASALKMLGRQK